MLFQIFVKIVNYIFNNVLMKSFNNSHQKSMEQKTFIYLKVSHTIENRGAVVQFSFNLIESPKFRAPITNYTHPRLQALIKGPLDIQADGSTYDLPICNCTIYLIHRKATISDWPRHFRWEPELLFSFVSNSAR